MATQVLNHVKCLVGKYDLTGWSNACALNYGADALDVTVFCNDTRVRKGGLKTVTSQLEGFWEAGATGPDKAHADYMALANVPVILIPSGSAIAASNIGQPAYGFLASHSEYIMGGSVGEMLKYTMRAEANGPLVRGNMLMYGSKTGSASGTAYQLGAPSAIQTVFACLQVYSAAVDTLDVILESDNAAGFPHAATRITFAQANDETYEWKTFVGGTTDDYWRVSWTLGAAGPFVFSVFMGIL